MAVPSHRMLTSDCSFRNWDLFYLLRILCGDIQIMTSIYMYLWSKDLESFSDAFLHKLSRDTYAGWKWNGAPHKYARFRPISACWSKYFFFVLVWQHTFDLTVQERTSDSWRKWTCQMTQSWYDNIIMHRVRAMKLFMTSTSTKPSPWKGFWQYRKSLIVIRHIITKNALCWKCTYAHWLVKSLNPNR